jgi:hypothetical protein
MTCVDLVSWVCVDSIKALRFLKNSSLLGWLNSECTSKQCQESLRKKISFSENCCLLTILSIKFLIEKGLKIIPNGFVVIWNLKYWNFFPMFSAKQDPKEIILES